MRVPTPLDLDVHAAGLSERIAALPAAGGIYALYPPASQPPHISWSVNLRRRLARLLVPSYPASANSFAKLRDNLQSVQCWPTASKLETSLLLYQLTRTWFPADYLFRLRLRMPWFVGLSGADPFPRLTVANRLPRKCNLLYGPFPSRDLAQHYEEEVLGLFQIRRCTETLLPAPNHPGCIYGEMNQCMRPCQCAVTPAEYTSEVERVAAFLSTNGKGAGATLRAARDRAAEETDFEQAAQLHKRIEKIEAVAALRPDAIAEVHRFNGVALTPALEARHFCLWPMLEGYWQEPLTVEFPCENLRARLEEALLEPCTSGRRLDDLALFSRWYHSSWRDGDWFPFHTPADLHYRRLLRAIPRLSGIHAPD